MENWRSFLTEQAGIPPIDVKSVALRAMKMAQNASNYLDKLEKPLTYTIKDSDDEQGLQGAVYGRARTNGEWYYGKINYHKIYFYRSPIEEQISKFSNLITEWVLQVTHSTETESTEEESTSITSTQREAIVAALLDIPAVIACSTIVHEIRHSYDYERYANVLKAASLSPDWLMRAYFSEKTKERSILASTLIKGLGEQPLPPAFDIDGEITRLNNVIEKYARKEEISFHPVMIDIAHQTVDKVSDILQEIIQDNLNMSLGPDNPQGKTLLENMKKNLFEEIARDISETIQGFREYEFAK